MSACASPLHSASVASRIKCDVEAKDFLFPDKTLNNGVPRCRCCRHALIRNNSAVVVVQANSLPDLEQQVCGQLAYRGRRNCELASLSVRNLRPVVPTRDRDLC